MITNGFVPSYGDVVTLDQAFSINGLNLVSAYILVGTAGNVVWENASGQPQYTPNVQDNERLIIGATKIVTSATVNGTLRTTTATNMAWLAINQAEND